MSAADLTWPVDPVDETLRGRLGPQDPRRPLTGYSSSNAAAVLGLHERTWQRYRSAGHVSDKIADRLACALNLHPVDLWPEWWERCLYSDDHPE